MNKTLFVNVLASLVSITLIAQPASNLWSADNGDGTYKNPVLHSDYSDPDAIRVGNDFYMTASSFNAIPGLPILHSKDLVNWTLIGHALKRQPPFEHYNKVQHGNGVWAPSIRFHKGEFYIYYPDPDFGIYLVKARSATGPWSEPILVEKGKGLIDPCPLWDDDGNAYLVHAFAGSRAGIKSVLIVKKMSLDGLEILDEGTMVYDGHGIDPTIEGPKFYKRKGYYYIFAPGGGVSTGWQTVLRSKSIYGPYERRVVMDQGKTSINGPHQGAWVQTQNGEDWFLHFQDKDAYGRIVHLQPMRWINDFPVIGEDKDGDGIGNPVLVHKKPNVGKSYPAVAVQASDEFNDINRSLQWQWHSNPQPTWSFMDASRGVLRLFTDKIPDSARNLWDIPNILLTKFPADRFTATTRVQFNPMQVGDRLGFAVMGEDYAFISLLKQKDGIEITYNVCTSADKGKPEIQNVLGKAASNEIFFKIGVDTGAVCSFSYSTDGVKFIPISKTFTAKPGRWIGAKLGYFCTRNGKTNDSGSADIDWFRIESE